MTTRFATTFICDDVLVALNGKFNVHGIYTGDVVIPHENFVLPQLVVMLEAQTPAEKPFQSMIFSVSLPGESSPRRIDLSHISNAPAAIPAERTVRRTRFPFLISNPTLNSGPIETLILHEEGQLLAGKHWVITIDEANARIANLVKGNT